MRMRINGQQLNVDGQGEVVGDHEIFLSRRNVELDIVFELQQHWQPGRGVRSEVKSDARLDQLWLSRWLKMCVQNQVSAFVEPQRHPIRLNVRNGSRLPKEQMTVGVKQLRLDANLHAAKACARLGFALARGCFAIHKNIRVVHIALISGTNLNRPHPTRFWNRHRENKIPICVGARGRQAERLVRRKHQIRFAELPAGNPPGLRSQIGRIAFDFSLLDPALDQINFGIRQAKLVREFELLRLRQPRGHGPRLCHIDDLSRMFFYVGVVQQRERRCLSRPMTGGARLKDDRGDVAVEGDLLCRRCNRGRKAG